MRKTCALVLTLALVATGVAGDDEIWGKPAAGLRLRAEAPPQPIGGSPLVRTLDFELRNDSDAEVAFERLGIRPRLEMDGKPLPDGILELPLISPLELRGDALGPGKSVRWSPRLIRTSDDAPEKLTLTAVLPAKDAELGFHHLESLPFEADLSRHPVPTELTEEHVKAGWTGGSVLVFRENSGIYGWRALEVWPDGTARAFRTRHGSNDDAIPAGLHTARLPADQQRALADTLLKHRVWTLEDTPPPESPRPHGTFLDVVVIEGSAAVIAKLRLGEDDDAERVGSLRESMRELMIEVVKLAADGD